MDALKRFAEGGSYQEESLRLLFELVELIKEIKRVITPPISEANEEKEKVLFTPFTQKRGRPRKYG